MARTDCPSGGNRWVAASQTISRSVLKGGVVDKLDLQVDNGRIVLVPQKAWPRAGWEDALRGMSGAGDDKPLIDDTLDLNAMDLTW